LICRRKKLPPTDKAPNKHKIARRDRKQAQDRATKPVKLRESAAFQTFWLVTASDRRSIVVLCERLLGNVYVWHVQLKCQCRPIMPILEKSPANDTTLWL